MPIARHVEPVDTIGPRLLYLWHYRWWILVPSLLLGIVVYLVLRALPGEYKVNAEMYVNRLSAMPDRDDVPNPATVASLLQNDALLYQVRRDYVQTFNVENPPQFEKFVKAFKVRTNILQDTTVKKDLSPVVELEVQYAGTSETRFLMESWMQNFLTRYGSFATGEAASKRQALQFEASRLEGEIQQAVQRRSKLAAELAFQEKVLAELVDLLAPANPSPKASPARQDMADNNAGTAARVNLVLNMANKEEGFLARRARLQLELAQAQTALQDASTTPAARLEARLKALSQIIDETATSVSQYQAVVAQTQAALEEADRSIVIKRGTLDRVQQSIDRYTVITSATPSESTAEMPAGSDVRALTMPVTPEKRVWPKRTVAAGSAALAAMVLISLALLVNQYLQGLVLRRTTVPPA